MVNGSRYSSGEVSQKDTAGLQLAASRAVLNALQASDMPAYMAKVLNSVSTADATQEQINAALDYAKALKQVRTAMDETRTPVEVLQATVDKGLTDLGTSADTFKKDFVAAIDSGLSPENFQAWNDLSTTMDSLATSAKAAADALKQTQSATSSSIGNIVKSVDAMHAGVAAADTKMLSAQDNIRSGYNDAQKTLNDLMLQASQNTLSFVDSIGAYLASISTQAASGGSLSSLKAQLSSTAVLVPPRNELRCFYGQRRVRGGVPVLPGNAEGRSGSARRGIPQGSGETGADRGSRGRSGKAERRSRTPRRSLSQTVCRREIPRPGAEREIRRVAPAGWCC